MSVDGYGGKLAAADIYGRVGLSVAEFRGKAAETASRVRASVHVLLGHHIVNQRQVSV